jgi:ATP-dependent DNA helicase RecG
MSHDTDAESEDLRDDLESDKSERKESWLGSSPKKGRQVVCAFAKDLLNQNRQVCSSLGPMTVAIHPTC